MSKTVQGCWTTLLKLDSYVPWSIEWVKGHSNILGNENADIMAKKATERFIHCPEPWAPIAPRINQKYIKECSKAVSYTHLTLPTNREV